MGGEQRFQRRDGLMREGKTRPQGWPGLPRSAGQAAIRLLRFRGLDGNLTRFRLLSYRQVDIEHAIVQMAFNLIYIEILRQRKSGVELPISDLQMGAGAPRFRRLPLTFENELVALRRNLETILGNARDDRAQHELILIPTGLDHRCEGILASVPAAATARRRSGNRKSCRRRCTSFRQGFSFCKVVRSGWAREPKLIGALLELSNRKDAGQTNKVTGSYSAASAKYDWRLVRYCMSDPSDVYIKIGSPQTGSPNVTQRSTSIWL